MCFILNFTSSINLSSRSPRFFCTPSLTPLCSSLPNSPLSAQLFIFSYYNSGNRVLSAWQSIPSEAGFTPLAALPLLLTRFPKGRKAHLWPSAWWAPTAVCSGITPAEKGGIPAPTAFVTARPLFAFDKTAVQSPPGPHGWREGKRTQGWLPFIGGVGGCVVPEVASKAGLSVTPVCAPHGHGIFTIDDCIWVTEMSQSLRK